MIVQNKDLKNKSSLIHILESDMPEQLKENIYKGVEQLLDLIRNYKAKRNLWEVKLQIDNDPRKPDLYAILARLSMLDMMVDDLEYLNQLFEE